MASGKSGPKQSWRLYLRIPGALTSSTRGKLVHALDIQDASGSGAIGRWDVMAWISASAKPPLALAWRRALVTTRGFALQAIRAREASKELILALMCDGLD